MMEIKAVIGETDMLQTMQQDALLLAGKALDLFDVNESTQIASFIKKGVRSIIRTRVAMHCGNRLWFLCDTSSWLVYLLQHRKPHDIIH
ncbi:hypothetical protein OPV22_032640 [Ensete ventricosum]|uniref:Dynein light chain n=1 Tax=Ensete ventricosum TaxID=4639 RepID=A0AAV8PL63_ENSVE|nr:hypothetical protein OPV22_032640 [Ensete ventricosum]